jgi:hypothetical protein
MPSPSALCCNSPLSRCRCWRISSSATRSFRLTNLSTISFTASDTLSPCHSLAPKGDATARRGYLATGAGRRNSHRTVVMLDSPRQTPPSSPPPRNDHGIVHGAFRPADGWRRRRQVARRRPRRQQKAGGIISEWAQRRPRCGGAFSFGVLRYAPASAQKAAQR